MARFNSQPGHPFAQFGTLEPGNLDQIPLPPAGYGSGGYGASGYGSILTYVSLPGHVLTQPGNIEPGTVPPSNVDATVLAPATFIGTIRATAPQVSTGATIAAPSTTFSIVAGQASVQASVQVVVPALQFAAVRAASPTVSSYGQIVIVGVLPYNSQPGNVLARPGALEPGALDVLVFPGTVHGGARLLGGVVAGPQLVGSLHGGVAQAVG